MILFLLTRGVYDIIGPPSERAIRPQTREREGEVKGAESGKGKVTAAHRGALIRWRERERGQEEH